MAVWGDIAASSKGIEADARAAVTAALEMRERLLALNVLRTADGLLPLRIALASTTARYSQGRSAQRRARNSRSLAMRSTRPPGSRA